VRAFKAFGREIREAKVTNAGHLVYNGKLLDSVHTPSSSVYHKYHWRVLNDQNQLELDHVLADIEALKGKIEQLNRSACEIVSQGQRLIADGD
jgi:hypothetical protein